MTSDLSTNQKWRAYDPNCPFCDRDELVVVAEAALHLVVYSKHSIVRGHCLIVPKRHVVSFLALTSVETEQLVALSRKVISAVLSAYETGSFDYALQEGVPAGGTIAHTHFHVIPRIIGDLSKPEDWYPELLERQFHPDDYERGPLSRDEMIQEARRISKHM